jgi:hypothetical protein
MTVTIVNVRESIDESLEILKNQNTGADYQELVSTLESVRNNLIRNEKKIWLRTKKGKDIVSEVFKAATKLRETLSINVELTSIEVELNKVEALVKAINEESRRKNMVVT